jgi:hypothetical protein
VVRIPTRLSAAELMKQAKGVSSRFMNELLPDGEGFRWQEGYGVFSVSRSHLKRVIAYVQHQKEHHSAGNLWPEWEETDTEYIPHPPPSRATDSENGPAPRPQDTQP